MKTKLKSHTWILLISFVCIAASIEFLVQILRGQPMAEVNLVNLTTPVMQFIPEVGNTNWFLREANGNTVVSGIMQIHAYVGPTAELKFYGRKNTGYVVEFSTNNVDWESIRVMLMGSDRNEIWYDDVYTNRLYRFRSFVGPPSQLNVQ